MNCTIATISANYWTLVVPLFALACVVGVPQIGVLGMLAFWVIPAFLRTCGRPTVERPASVSLVKTTGPQMPVA